MMACVAAEDMESPSWENRLFQKVCLANESGGFLEMRFEIMAVSLTISNGSSLL
jgi:hypothetical protein